MKGRVERRGVLFGVVLAGAVILIGILQGCGILYFENPFQPGDVLAGNDPYSVTGLMLTGTDQTLVCGHAEYGTAQLKAEVLPETADNQTILWSSSSPEAASVDARGVVTAGTVAADTTVTITAETEEGGYTRSCTLLVQPEFVPVESLSLNNTGTVTIPVLKDSFSNPYTITPSNATNQKVSWTGDKDIADYDTKKGSITAQGVGTTTITVTADDDTNGTLSASCTVEAGTQVTSVEITSPFSPFSLTPGGQVYLEGRILPGDASIRDVTLSSSASGIVSVADSTLTVDSQGEFSTKLTGGTLGGPVTITVTSDDTSSGSAPEDTCSVSVREVDFTLITGDGLVEVSSSDIELADLNGDSFPDVVLTGDSDGSRCFKIYHNNGDGSFTQKEDQTAVYKSFLALGDFNGDGDLDIFAAGHTGSNPFAAVYENDGSGSFPSSETFSGLYEGDAVSGDLDGDGYDDLVISGNTGSTYTTQVYLGAASGGVTEVPNPFNTNAPVPWREPSLDLGDINQDGHLDLVIQGINNNDNSKPIEVYLGDGDGTFTWDDSYSDNVYWPMSANDLVLGDLDGDGYPDLVKSGDGISSQTHFYENEYPSLSFENYLDWPGSVDQVDQLHDPDMVLADFDCDGDLDLLMSGEMYDSSGGVTQLYLNTEGDFNPASLSLSFPNLLYPDLAVGDIDDDGDLDFILSGNDGGAPKTSIYENTFIP